MIDVDIDMIFEEVYEAGDHCDGCEYMHVFKESRPWGDTVAYETFRECNNTMTEECLGVQDVIKQLLEEGE